MDSLAGSQRKFVENFLSHSKRVLQCGFSYAFAHPETLQELNEKVRLIRLLECHMRKSPADKSRTEHLVKEAYINYIMSLTRLGFKYIRLHPSEYEDIAELNNIFRSYDELMQVRHTTKVDRKCRERRTAPDFNKTFDVDPKIVDSDADWENMLEQLQNLTRKFDTIQGKLEKQRPLRPQQKMRPKSAVSIVSTEQTLKRFNKKLEMKLSEIQMKKNRRMLKQKYNDEHSDLYSDSDQDSSEVMLSVDHFNQISPKPSFKEPYVDRIERHMVIPIYSNDNPKITPHYRVKKSPLDGTFQIEMSLEFENEIPFQDQVVKKICIENNFPKQNFRHR